MRRLILAASLLSLCVAGPVTAQTPPAIGTSMLVWDQDAPDLATAQSYSFKYYPDGAAAGTALSGVSCSGSASPFLCQAAFPAFTPGTHTLVLTANNVAGESPKSAPPFGFVFVVTPGAPANLRIK